MERKPLIGPHRFGNRNQRRDQLRIRSGGALAPGELVSIYIYGTGRGPASGPLSTVVSGHVRIRPSRGRTSYLARPRPP